MIHEEELSLANTHRTQCKINNSADPGNAMALVWQNEPGQRKLDPLAQERARRLVAAWNALIGMSTEDIEAMAAEGKRKRESLAADEALTG